MTSPATIEPPAKVPPPSEVDQLTQLLVAGASVAVVAGFLSGLVGVGAGAVRRLLASSEWPSLIELPGPTWDGYGGPVMAQHLSNLRHRAAYLIMASRRVGTALVWERSQSGSVQRALEKERTYLRQHLQAVQRRNEAALKVATAQARYGPDLGWYAILDDRTSAECRRAHGSNFRADQPPRIGYPGTVHTHCRCKPGPPHQTERRVDDRTAPRELIALARHDVDSRTLPDIPNKPGKTNWVEKAGGLPSYIERIAKHLQANGHSASSAIATAVNTVRRWAAGGTVTAHGGPKVSAKTQAQAAAAYAEWKAKAAASHGGGKN